MLKIGCVNYAPFPKSGHLLWFSKQHLGHVALDFKTYNTPIQSVACIHKKRFPVYIHNFVKFGTQSGHVLKSEYESIFSHIRCRAYDPAEFDHLPVSKELKELFQHIRRYTPQNMELDLKLKPFIPDYIPAIGDIDAFIKVCVCVCVIYLSVCLSVCRCLYMSMCVCVFIKVFVSVSVHVSVCQCLCVFVSVSVPSSRYVCAFIKVCLCLCMCVCLCVHVPSLYLCLD